MLEIPVCGGGSKIQKYSIKLVHSLIEKEYILSCCNEAFANPITRRKEYKELLKKWNAAGDFVVAFNKNILGFAILYSNNYITSISYLTEIAVNPKYQNMHIGKALIAECEMLAENHNMSAIELEVQSDNIGAIRFYVRNGFVETRREEKSVYMRKTIWQSDGRTVSVKSMNI